MGADIAAMVLADEEVQLFTEKQVEYATPLRTYCARPSCARFIPRPKQSPRWWRLAPVATL